MKFWFHEIAEAFQITCKRTRKFYLITNCSKDQRSHWVSRHPNLQALSQNNLFSHHHHHPRRSPPLSFPGSASRIIINHPPCSWIWSEHGANNFPHFRPEQLHWLRGEQPGSVHGRLLGIRQVWDLPGFLNLGTNTVLLEKAFPSGLCVLACYGVVGDT